MVKVDTNLWYRVVSCLVLFDLVWFDFVLFWFVLFCFVLFCVVLFFFGFVLFSLFKNSKKCTVLTSKQHLSSRFLTQTKLYQMLRWVSRKFSGNMALTEGQQEWLDYFQSVSYEEPTTPPLLMLLITVEEC